jgi:chitin synthase
MSGQNSQPSVPAPPAHCANAVCVTVYNEGGEPFRNTLASLLRSIGRFHGDAAHRDSHSTICVIADGRERMQESLLAILRDGGLLRAVPARDDRGDEFHVTECRLAAAAGLFGGCADLAGAAGMVRFIICIKAENRGKLDSHDIFFNAMCVNLKPRYCYQVDTGTTLHPDTMLRLHEAFERDPGLAALAPAVSLPTPRATASILESWQYYDFACRNAVGWPFEVLTGYLSVLPGQTSVMRWSALGHQRPDMADATTPLVTYLRGPAVNAPLKKLMYLAEDRVIGGELVFSGGECRHLDYVDAARATTDSCTSYSELFRQRRRWANGSTACRIWMLARWPEWLRRADRSLAEKLHFSLALIAQVGFSLQDFLAPAQWLALIAVIAYASAEGAPFVLPAMLACTAVELALGAIGRRRRPWSRIAAGAAAATTWISAALYVYFLFFCLPAPATVLLLIPALALLPLVRTTPREGWARVVAAQFSPITYLFVSSLLSAYAVYRLDDVSWGTRGLTKTAAVAAQAGKLRRLRNHALAVWALVNAAGAALAFMQPGYLVSALNPVVELYCLLNFALAAGAVIFSARGKRAMRASARPAAQAGPEAVAQPASAPPAADAQSLISLVDEVARRGITLSARPDGKLAFRAPSGALTGEMRAHLSAHREALVDMISAPRFRAHGPRAQIPFLESYANGFWQKIRSGEVGVAFTNGTRWIVQVDGPFSPAAFAASVEIVASWHDILGVTIREPDGAPCFCRERTPRVEFVDLATEAAAPGAERVLRAVTDIALRPFVPEVDLLFRPFVVRVSESRHVIGFVLNHLVGDGASVGLLGRQLVAAYETAARGRTPEIARPEIQYSDYILTMNAWLAGPARNYRLAYWRRKLDGIAPCKLPVDRAVDPARPDETRSYSFCFDADQTALVHQLARDLSTTAYFVLVAAYARALAAATRQRSVALATMYHGRDDPALARTVGSMQNQLLLRIPAGQGGPFASLVHTARGVQTEAIEFQLPFGLVCYDTPGVAPHTSYPELNFSLARGGDDKAAPGAEVSVAPHELRRRMTPFEIVSPTSATCARDFPGIKLILQASDTAVLGWIDYLPSEYDESTIARFAQMIVAAVESAEPAAQRLAVG